MNITEVVKHVKRDKLPRDPEWLRKRIFHLISLLWFHYKQLDLLVPEANRFYSSETTRPILYVASTKHAKFGITISNNNPVFAPPLYDILNVLQGTSARITKYKRPPKIQFISLREGFPKMERFLYHLQAYEHIQEDLERTVRSAARMNIT